MDNFDGKFSVILFGIVDDSVSGRIYIVRRSKIETSDVIVCLSKGKMRWQVVSIRQVLGEVAVYSLPKKNSDL